MSVSITIAGSTVTFDEGSFQLQLKADERQQCTFTVIDYTGTLFFSRGEQVTVTDPTLGLLYTGYIVDVAQDKSNTYPDPTIEHQISCVDNLYLADKRTSNLLYSTPNTAARLVLDQIAVLAPEGVTTAQAQSAVTTQSGFGQGKLTGVSSTSNLGGDLELSPAGYTTTLTGALTTDHINVLVFSGYASSGYTTAYTYRQIWAGSITITSSSDAFIYSIWVNSSSPQIMAICDFVCSDGTTLSSTGALDLQGIGNSATTDLSGLASDTWYNRYFAIPGSLVGKTIVSFIVGLGGTNSGTYTAYYGTITYNTSSPSANYTIFGAGHPLAANNQAQNIAYSSVSLTQAIGSVKQTWATLTTPLNGPGIIESSKVIWTASIPSGVSASVYGAIDSVPSPLPLVSGGSIPGLLAGSAVPSGTTLQALALFVLGKDPTALPLLSPFTMTVTSAPASTKSDVYQTWTLGTDFNTGTYTNTALFQGSGPGITLNGIQPNWGPNTPSGTLFGGVSPTEAIIGTQIKLTTAATADARFRLDSVGTWQNFTVEVDITVPSGYYPVSLTYRNTGYQNNNDTYGYLIALSTSGLQFGHGTNSSSGAGSFTSIATASVPISANSTHRLKAVVNGTSHQFYLDGVLYLSSTDATYSATGSFAIRVYSNSGTVTGYFSNFGVVSALSGTWQSPALSLSSASIYGNSVIMWDATSLPDTTTTMTVTTSVDGGSTFQAATNGKPIANLSRNQSLTGKTLIVLITLAATNAPVVPVTNGLTVWVQGLYSSTGNRSTTPLGNDTMVRANQSHWGTAFDGQTWALTGTATDAIASNEATLVNTTGDAHEVLGSTNLWADQEATVRVKLSASTISAGIELRYGSSSAYYRLTLSTTAISIVRNVGSGNSTLATTAITASTGIYYRLRFRIQGSGPANLSGKFWADGTLEPGVSAGVMSATSPGWNVTYTDNT